MQTKTTTLIEPSSTLEVPQLHHAGAMAYGTKTVNEREGIVKALVGVSGNLDHDRDVIVPTAFAWGLKQVNPKGVHAHDWKLPTARTIEASEVEPGNKSLPGDLLTKGLGALDVTMQFNLKTQLGRETFETVDFYGDEQQWSIGYQVPKDGALISTKPPKSVADVLIARGLDFDRKLFEQLWAKSLESDGLPARYIMLIKVWEYSDVLFGANDLTRTGSVKTMDPQVLEDEAQSLLDAAKQLRDGDSKIVTVPIADDSAPELLVDADNELKQLEEAVSYTHALLVDSGDVLVELPTKQLERLSAVEDATSKLLDAVLGKEALAGSYEERRELVGAAVRSALAGVENVWLYVVATFDDHVIVCVTDERTDNTRGHFHVPYTIEDGDVVLGTPAAVTLETVVVPAVTTTTATAESTDDEHKIDDRVELPERSIMAFEHERSQL